MMRAYNQMMALQHQTKYKNKMTVGEALRFLAIADYLTGLIFEEYV